MECENCKRPAIKTTRYTVAREIAKWKIDGYQSTTTYTRFQMLECNHVFFCTKCYKRYNLFRLAISGTLGSLSTTTLLIWQTILFKIHFVVFFILIGLMFFSIFSNWLIINSIGKKIPFWIQILRFLINFMIFCWFLLLFEEPLSQIASMVILSLGVISDYLIVYYIVRNYGYLISDYAIYLNRKRLRKFYGKNVRFFNILNESDLKREY
jgi:hypothetical protein